MEISTAGRLLFWMLLAVPATAFLAYPVALRFLYRLRRRLVVARTAQPLPRVSIIVSAYNEGNVLGARIQNLLALDYPAELLEILVATDGSSDASDAVVQACGDSRVRLVQSPANLGKSRSLSLAVDRAASPLLIVTDANSMFHPLAVRRLVRWFEDGNVGIVCGRLTYTDARRNSAACEEMRYWSWDNGLKQAEGRMGLLVGGNGSILAIRRDLAVPLPATVANDLAWCNFARLRGYAVGFEPRAVAYEETAGTTRGEYRRRVRIITRGWNGIALSVRHLAEMPRGERAPAAHLAAFFVQLVAKKLFRYLAFPALLAAMILGLFLGGLPEFGAALLMWSGLAAAVGVGLLQPLGRRIHPRWPNPIYSLALATASIAALLRFLTGRRVGTWVSHRAAPIIGAPPDGELAKG